MIDVIKNYLLKYKYYLIFGVVLITSLIINFCAIKSCSNYKSYGNNNVKALTDSIHYYKSRNGELVASKTILEGDLSTLKIANDSLYNIIKDMSVKDPTSVIYVDNYIDRPVTDTIWNTDTIIPNFNIKRNFAFNDKYRSLEGYVSAVDTALGLKIEKDQTYFDYTIALEGTKVKIKSNNPYVKYNEITGITIPNNKKKWSLGVGPVVGYGYDLQHKQFGPYVGIGASISYNILQW